MLTEKQKRFCEEYLTDLNATNAAKRAGYSEKTAYSIGDENLKKPEIREYLQKLIDERSERTKTTSDDVIGELRAIAFSSEIEITGREKMKALELLGKHLGMFTGKLETNEGGARYNGIPATMIAPVFATSAFDISEHGHTEYIFPGGRGSTKSSFVSLSLIDLLMQRPDIHALVLRQFSNTLKDSVFTQLLWAVSMLGLENEFTYTKSPLEITYKKTGQKIYFRGADDPMKVKSIKPEFGYIGALWFEELDQFHGAETVRSIEQSAIRGGDIAYIFKTFNPPKSALNWANKYVKIPKAERLITESTYLDVPQKWLGKPFLDEAEFLRDTNPDAYENEYLGKANGSGGNVFENVEIREITDEEINTFDNIMNGIDWGYYPDKFAFMRVHYAAGQHTLFIFDEYTSNKQSNRETAEAVKAKGITAADVITCDSAEPKSIGDYRAFGLSARGAEKGPDSRRYSYKWLQGLRKIVIDNRRCPIAAEEFIGKEYERDRDGNIVSGYPDGNDHTIDAVRYATERKWRKRGQ